MTTNDEKALCAESMPGSDSNLDKAWDFIDHHRNPEALALIDIASVRNKVDWHIVSMMFLCYTMQFLDKVAINVRPNLAKLLYSVVA